MPPEMVPQNDPSYNGIRYDEMWVLTAIDPTDNQEGVMPVSTFLAAIFGLQPGYAIAADEVRLVALREYAKFCKDSVPEYKLTIKHFVLESTDDNL